jgi:hypothetical protein
MNWKHAKYLAVCLAALLFLFTACSGRGQVMDGGDMVRSDTQISQDETKEMMEQDEETSGQGSELEEQMTDEEKTDMKLKIEDTEVPVTWEENESAEALKTLADKEPLMIQMSMYGGFEQVGPIGQSIVSNDRQTTTQAGDIVLYSGDQIVVFYGSNSWAYTRLGHVDLSQ